MADIGNLNTSGGANVAGPSFETETGDDRQALLDAHKRNMQLGLLAAGLGILAYRPQRHERGSLGHAIGEGGLMGLQAYESGEQSSEQELQRRQSSRALNAYRQQKIGIQEKGIDEQSRRTDIMAGGQGEKVRHDQAMEANAGAGRGIQQQNANTAAYRASLDAQRVGLEGSKLANEYAPIGADVIKGYRGTNVEKLMPLLDPETVKAMPKKDALAYQREVQKSYSQMAKDPNVNIKFEAMGDGQLHKFVTNVKTGETKDAVMGKAAPRGKGAAGTTLADSIKAATGGSPAAAVPAPVPSPATDTTNPTPSSAPPMAEPKIGKRMGPVDSSKYQNGKVYRNPKTGQRVIIKDGVAYEAA